MLDLLQEIRKLEGITGLSKHEQLVRGIINAINDKVVCKGDILPSINYLVKELGFARGTITKAYKDLEGRGIIRSEGRMGFYVAEPVKDW
ncbi:MAG TPA: GntR family transcriptional regulator [Puia sp.]|nr:GntR family transcriptional regulator [Puia sp.]